MPIRGGHVAAAAPDGPTITVSASEFSAMQMQLRSMESQQRRLNDALKALLESRHAISTLQVSYSRCGECRSTCHTLLITACAPQCQLWSCFQVWCLRNQQI